MIHFKSSFLIVAVAAAGLALAACGDSNPSSPSGTGGVVVRGVLLGEGAAFTSSSSGAASSSGGPITVMVEGTSISVTISGNGTWELEDVPAGDFTLVFIQDGQEIGRIEITAEDGVEVDVVVKIEDGAIVLVKLEFDDDDDDDDDGDDDGDDDDGDDGDDDGDEDGDGVNDDDDLCPGTPPNTPVDEVGCELDDEEYDTIGGLVMHELGRLPRRGESVEFGGFEFAVTKADKRRIDSLRVQRNGT